MQPPYVDKCQMVLPSRPALDPYVSKILCAINSKLISDNAFTVHPKSINPKAPTVLRFEQRHPRVPVKSHSEG